VTDRIRVGPTPPSPIDPAAPIPLLPKNGPAGLDQLGDTQVARGSALGLVFTTKNGTPLCQRQLKTDQLSAIEN
jgi:hypothetical protein